MNSANPIQRVAFQPNAHDKEGISVFRQQFVAAEDVAAAGAQGAANYFVVRLQVKDVLSLGLSVMADPQPDQLPGHALIPELSWAAWRRQKPNSKEQQRALRALGEKDIAFTPFPGSSP